MYAKLALRNVKRQIGNYLIYFMTVALTVALLFAISNVIFSENLEKFTSSREMRSGLVGMVVLISAIVAFVLRYATAFMLRLRKREFGTYLTLGMTRGDLLRIFLAETTWICLGALAVGLLLGLFLYQGLMVVMMHLLEMTFTIAAYSVKGLILTISLVLGIFLLASVTSALYLKRVSIYELLHAEQKVEGTVQHAGFWFFMTALSFCLMVGSPVAFYLDLERVLTIGRDAQSSMLWLMAFAVSVIVFHIGLARSTVFVLLRRKKFRSRSTNTFVLRQLSGTLRSSCVMLGFLAFLLTFTVVGANVAFVQKASQQAQLNRNCPYDIQYTENLDYEMTGDRPGQGIAQDVAEQTIASYVPIRDSFSYQVYTSNDDFFHSQTRWSGEGYEMLDDTFMKLSDFNALITPLGYAPVSLDQEYLIVSSLASVEAIDWSDCVLERGGKTYTVQAVASDYPVFCRIYFYVVVPDEVVEGMAIQTNYTVYDVADGPYDAVGLRQALTYLLPNEYDGGRTSTERCDYLLREYVRQEENSINAILVVGALFIAAVFLLLTMAILALKTLSSLADDRKRYEILSRLGADRRTQCKTLQRQTFWFFLLPFAVPVLTSFPVAMVCRNLMRIANQPELLAQIPVIAAAVLVTMVLVYLLYYAATYLIAKKTVIGQPW